MDQERRNPGMNGPFVSTGSAISRRKFLRGAGILLSLPMLDAMSPAFAAVRRISANATPGGKPRRLFAICNNLGLLPDQFFPNGSGRDYALSPYLELLREQRNDFTVFSGVSHPDVDGGHPADNCFLTAAPHPGRGGFRNNIAGPIHCGAHRTFNPVPLPQPGGECRARLPQPFVDKFGCVDSLRRKALRRL